MILLKKLGNTLDQGIKTIGSKSKEFVETTRLKGEIKDIEKAIQEQYSDLGKKIFEMFNKENFSEDELRTDSEVITNLYKKINEIKETLSQIDASTKQTHHETDKFSCPICNACNHAGQHFCTSCGSSLSKEQSEIMWKCAECGVMNKSGNKFCGSCGCNLHFAPYKS